MIAYPIYSKQKQSPGGFCKKDDIENFAKFTGVSF